MMNFSMLANLTAFSQDVLPISQQDIQLRSNQQIDSNNTTLGGFLLIFLLIGYICVGLGYKKHRLKKRKAARLQQVKTLDKIWKMPAYQRKK